MNKREQKKHERKVSRAKSRVKLSEPDIRTPEQLRADRDASRPAGGQRNSPLALFSAGSNRKQSGPAGHGAAKTDLGS